MLCQVDSLTEGYVLSFKTLVFKSEKFQTPCMKISSLRLISSDKITSISVSIILWFLLLCSQEIFLITIDPINLKTTIQSGDICIKRYNATRLKRHYSYICDAQHYPLPVINTYKPLTIGSIFDAYFPTDPYKDLECMLSTYTIHFFFSPY